MEKSEEVCDMLTTTSPEQYTNQDPNWGFIDYCKGVVECWAGTRSGYLAVAIQEWALRHPDRFSSIKAMTTVSEGCIFILYTPSAEAPLAEKVSPGLIRGLQQCFIQVAAHDVSKLADKPAVATDTGASEKASATDTMPAEHDV